MSHPKIVTGQSSPVLVVGMHRSGTRLLAEVLDRLGIFMGADQQADGESVTFMLLNEAILHQCGAFWSEPMAAHFVLAEPETVSQLAWGTATMLDRQKANYLGLSSGAVSSDPDETRRFGWKDPRNTFTLPVWRHLFPDLKVIHIVRHGVDVAVSLARRHSEALQVATGKTVPGALTVIRDQTLAILSSRRGWTLSEALTMWEQYVEKARLESAELGENVLEICFEELLEQPGRVIADVAKFCDVPDVIEGTAFLERVNSIRAYAYRQKPELVEFAESERAVLAQYGYSP